MKTIIIHEGKLNLFIDKQNLSNSELSELVGTKVTLLQPNGKRSVALG